MMMPNKVYQIRQTRHIKNEFTCIPSFAQRSPLLLLLESSRFGSVESRSFRFELLMEERRANCVSVGKFELGNHQQHNVRPTCKKVHRIWGSITLAHLANFTEPSSSCSLAKHPGARKLRLWALFTWTLQARSAGVHTEAHVVHNVNFTWKFHVEQRWKPLNTVC